MTVSFEFPSALASVLAPMYVEVPEVAFATAPPATKRPAASPMAVLFAPEVIFARAACPIAVPPELVAAVNEICPIAVF